MTKTSENNKILGKKLMKLLNNFCKENEVKPTKNYHFSIKRIHRKHKKHKKSKSFSIDP